MIYAALLGVALLARLALAVSPVEYMSAGQEMVWSWRFFAVFVACFWIAAAVATRARLPTPAETLARARTALGLPIVAGIAVALLTIASDIRDPVADARGFDTVHVGGWIALPFYAYGAIVLTTVFHFLPIALLAWLGQRLPATSRAVLVGVGIVAIGFSEDAGFFFRDRPSLGLEWARHALSVVANATEALFIYRFGFLSGLAQRASTYLLWHGAWPGIAAS